MIREFCPYFLLFKKNNKWKEATKTCCINPGKPFNKTKFYWDTNVQNFTFMTQLKKKKTKEQEAKYGLDLKN